MSLEIKIPKEAHSLGPNSVCIERADWYDLIAAVEDMNKMLAGGITLIKNNGTYAWFEKENVTQKTIDSREGRISEALLINIQPIKKETAEDVLRDLVALEFMKVKMNDIHDHDNRPLNKLKERAKAVLEKK